MVALHGGFGGSFNLNQAINWCSLRYSSTLLTSIPSPHAFGEGLDVRKRPDSTKAVLDEAKHLFICDCGGLVTLARYLSVQFGKDVQWKPSDPASTPLYEWLGNKSLIFFWSGTIYSEMHEEINAAVAKLPCVRRYAMCDLLRHDPPALPLMQTYDNLAPIDRKFDEFTICHSPGQKYGADKKGSALIEAAIAEVALHLPVKAQVLKDIPHKKSLVIKAMCHIFVDQIASAAGGMGKSGLEALCLGVPTLCDLRNATFAGYYADMPALDVRDKNGLVEAIESLYRDPGRKMQLGRLCAAWAQRLKYEPTVKYLERTMEWA